MHLNLIRRHISGHLVLISVGILVACNSREQSQQTQAVPETIKEQGYSIKPVFEMEWVSNAPVLTEGDPGTENNKYGFEGGRVIKYNNEYHMFTTEMYGNPLWTKTRLGYWKSKDGFSWERISTLFESTGDFTGEDPRACLWSPIPTYDAKNGHWVLTYVAYNSKPNTDEAWHRNHNGKIWMAVSEVSGYGGLAGPYKDQAIVLKAGPESDDWEGLMGTNSFFPFPVCDSWMAFYGSSPESVGLARAPDPEGPWERISEVNPVCRHIENPIVTRLSDGRYVALWDGCGEHRKIGYMISEDGILWSEEVFLDPGDIVEPWWALTRTPLGLIQESEDLFTVFFTAYNKDMYEIPHVWKTNDDSVFDGYFASMGMFKIRLVN